MLTLAIFNESSNNESKDNIMKIKENNDIKRKYSNCLIKQKIPKNPISLKNRKIERKNNNMIGIDIESKNTCFNKFENLGLAHIRKSSNNSLYVDKHENNSYLREENKLNLNKKFKKEDKEFANKFGAIFYSTSAKENVGIDALFKDIATKLVELDNKSVSFNNDTVSKLSSQDANSKKKCC